jgi:sirohydrochlorin ferrochelatase
MALIQLLLSLIRNPANLMIRLQGFQVALRSQSLRLVTVTSLAAALIGTPFATAAAQTGLLVVAHGADSVWNAAVRATVAQARWAEGPVRIAFLMGPESHTAGWDAGMQELVEAGARRVVIVPLMVSSHGSHYSQIQHYAGLLAEMPAGLVSHDHREMPAPPTVPVAVTPALDVAPELGAALTTRWLALDTVDRRRAVVLVAHGPESDAEAREWSVALTAVGTLLHAAGLERDYRVGLLRDDAPAAMRAAAIQEMRDTILALNARTGDSVVAIPVLIATSSITTQRIPADLAGLPVRYAQTPLTPHPAIARWIERVGSAAAASFGVVCASDSVTGC